MAGNPNTAELSVFLLGPFRMRYAGAYQTLSLTGTTRELLAYLLARSDEVTRRDVLIDLFWPASTSARGRSALTTALCRIKKVLGKVDGLALESFDDLVTISADPTVSIDVLALRRSYEQGRRQLKDEGALDVAARRNLAGLVRTSRGAFLDGSDAHWVLVERERMTALGISVLRLLMRDAEARGEYEDAIDWAREVLSNDPLLEAVHHDLIALYAKAGERRRAVLQYEKLWEILRDELAIEPDSKTTALRDQILAQPPENAPVSVVPTRHQDDSDDAVTHG